MIIDTNTHLGHWPFRKLAHSDADGLLRLLDGFGVAQAWVGAFAGIFYRDCGQANRDLCAEVAGHEDRLVPWAAINPAFPDWEADLAEAVQAGMVGVRLYPNYHGYTLGEDCCLELLAALVEHGLPVAIYHKLVDERLHHWRCLVPPTDMAVAPLAERFPTLPMICCGVNALILDQLKPALQGGRVYIETSRFEGAGGLADLIATAGADRVLFGSHAPYFYLEANLLKLVESGLEETTREALLYRNALSVPVPA